MGLRIVPIWVAMGTKRDSRRGWWAVVVLIAAAVISIFVWLIPAILREDSGRNRGFLAAGTEYELAIGTVSEAGNISFIETSFTTAK